MAQVTKSEEYAAKLIGHFESIFDEESDFYINPKEFEDDSNATDFIHALANVMPNYIYGKLTKQQLDLISFNHIANRLCFQNSILE